MRTVLVCGGRTYADREALYVTLDREHKVSPIKLLVHGGAPGADSLAREWAASRGVRSRAYLADWKKYGSAAGPIRNKRMLDEEEPDLVIAFPGGRGTNNMTFLAAKAGVSVVFVGGRPDAALVGS